VLDLSGPLGKKGRTTWRGEEGKGSREKGRAKIGKEGVALAPRKKIPAGTHASVINLLLNWLIDGKLLIEASSSFQI